MDQEQPNIIHTDDEPGWGNKAKEILAVFGISTTHFATNDEAKTYLADCSVNAFPGALIDYCTFSSVSGVDLIQVLVESGVCGDVIVLSSSTDRGSLQRDLREHGVTQNIEIFLKHEEYALAGVYIAIRILFPDMHVTRNGMLRAIGFNVDGNGDVKGVGTFDVMDRNEDLRREILRQEFNLKEFALKAQELSVEESSK